MISLSYVFILLLDTGGSLRLVWKIWYRAGDKKDMGTVRKSWTRDENATSRVLGPPERINRFPRFVPRLRTIHTPRGNPFRKALANRKTWLIEIRSDMFFSLNLQTRSAHLELPGSRGTLSPAWFPVRKFSFLYQITRGSSEVEQRIQART